MISLTRKDGTEVDVQICNDSAEVDRMLTALLQPEIYTRLKKELANGGEEIFFEFTGASKEELPLMPILSRRPRYSPR
jgi:hypothetical protein